MPSLRSSSNENALKQVLCQATQSEPKRVRRTLFKGVRVGAGSECRNCTGARSTSADLALSQERAPSIPAGRSRLPDGRLLGTTFAS